MHNLLRTYIVLTLGFLYLPVSVLIWYSFRTDLYNPVSGLMTGRWYRDFFYNDMLVTGLRNSLIVALIAAAVSVLLGILLAYGLHRYQFRLKKSLGVLVNLILIAPDISVAIGLTLVFQILHVTLGLIAIIIAHVTFGIGYATLLIAARLRSMSHHLEDAARDLGATEWQAVRLIVMPIIKPAILAALLVCFTLSWDDFIFAFYNSAPGETTLPVQLFALIKRGANPGINAIGSISMLVSFILIFVSLRFQKLISVF